MNVLASLGLLFDFQEAYVNLRNLSAALLSGTVIATLFNLIVIFFRLYFSVKNLRSKVVTTFTLKQIIFLSTAFILSFGFIAFTMIEGYFHLTSLFVIFLCLSFGSVSLFGAKKFTSLIAKLANPSLAKRVRKFMSDLGKVLVSYVLSMAVFTFAVLNTENLKTRTFEMIVLQDISVTLGGVLIMAFFYTIHEYLMDFTGKSKSGKRPKRKTSMMATTKVSSVAPSDIASSHVQSSVASDVADSP